MLSQSKRRSDFLFRKDLSAQWHNQQLVRISVRIRKEWGMKRLQPAKLISCCTRKLAPDKWRILFFVSDSKARIFSDLKSCRVFFSISKKVIQLKEWWIFYYYPIFIMKSFSLGYTQLTPVLFPFLRKSMSTERLTLVRREMAAESRSRTTSSSSSSGGKR